MLQNQLDAKGPLVKVIEDALQELSGLERQNSKMKNALSEIQSEICDLNQSVASIKAKENSFDESEEPKINLSENGHHAKHKILLYQLKISSDITAKLSSKIESNLHNGLLHDAFQSSISEIKKKLASLAMIVQELMPEGSSSLKSVSKSVNDTHSCENHPSSENRTSDAIPNSSVLNLTIDEMQLQLNDALDKNIRWQNYNVEREQYVTLLLSKYNQNCSELQNLREKMSQITSKPDKLAAEQRRHFDKLLVGARQELEHQRNQNLLKVTELKILKDKHQDEINHLESNVEKWRKRYEDQRETLAALNANYENEKRRSSSSAIESKEKQSQIQLLQRQVQVLTEDLRAERKEKDLAIEEVKMLNIKINQLQNELEKHKKPPIMHKKVSTTDLPKVNCEHIVKSQNQSLLDKRITGKILSSNSNLEFNYLKDRANITVRRPLSAVKSQTLNYEKKHKQKDIIETSSTCFDTSEASEFSVGFVNSLAHKNISNSDSVLQCPSCGKKYDINEHMSLLDHIDVCGD